MKRTIYVFVVAALGAASCYAPIHDKPAGQNYHGELSQSQMTKLQGSGVIGETPEPMSAPETTSATTSPAGKNSEEANQVLSGADPASNAAAQRSLSQAAKDAEHHDLTARPGFALMMGGLFVLVGLGIAYGFKSYMDKVVPEPKNRRVR